MRPLYYHAANMTAPLIPRQAFIPRGMHNGHERRMFAERRDLLFSLCTPDEQRSIHALTSWYESHWYELIAKPNLLSKCQEADFHLRYLYLPDTPKLLPVQRATLKWCATVGRWVTGVEKRIGNWSQDRCIAFLRSTGNEWDEDVLIGVVDFLRLLPLQVGAPWEQRRFQDGLASVTKSCMTSNRVSARRRMDAVMRCIDRAYDPGSYSLPDCVRDLRKQAWSLLLELEKEDIQSALHIVDEQGLRKGKANSLSTMDLHEAPQLAYQLATALRPHRVAFASEMLRESIQYSSFQRSRLESVSAAALGQVMDASCRLLAGWIIPGSGLSHDDVLRSIHRLFQYGNPEDAYWMTLPEQALAIVRHLPVPELRRHLGLLVLIAVYGEGGESNTAAKARMMFDQSVEMILGDLRLTDRDRGQDSDDLFSTIGSVIFELSQCLKVFENKSGSMRNARVAAHPDHIVVITFETRVDAFVHRLIECEPADALLQLARVAVHLNHERLFLKHHQLFREQFAARAPMFPEDAGRSLKTVIKYCAYSQSDDEMYRKDVCQETFDALLPLLDAISTHASEHARTGIGWSLRGNI